MTSLPEKVARAWTAELALWIVTLPSSQGLCYVRHDTGTPGTKADYGPAPYNICIEWVYQRCAQAVLTALGLADGSRVIVPREPTEAMIEAWNKAYWNEETDPESPTEEAYRAMIFASQEAKDA